jgi:hypothetical protein
VADDDKNPFSPRGVLPDPGPASTAREVTEAPNPFEVTAPTLSPQQYVVDRLRRSSYYRRNFAYRPHISTTNGVPYGPTLLREAEIIDEYLRNGVGNLTKAHIQLIMDALAEPETPARLAGSDKERAAWDRHIRDTINQLRVEQVRKKQ